MSRNRVMSLTIIVLTLLTIGAPLEQSFPFGIQLKLPVQINQCN